MKKEDLIKKVENNIRFAITISIFFLAIFSEIRLEGSVLVVAYLLCYVAFEMRASALSLRHLMWIKNALFVGIGSYIIPLTTIGLSTQGGVLEPWEALTLMGSLAISMYIIVIAPASILVMIVLLRDFTWTDLKRFLNFKKGLGV